MKILIIGGGPAAFEAALAARGNAPDAEIAIRSREAVPPYRRPALSRMVAEPLGDAAFYLKPAEFYAEAGIDLQLKREAAGLNPPEHRVTFADGGTEQFDRLIIATGARCFVPPIPGAERAFTLREFADLERLRARLDAGARTAAVIGGGVLGLELADALCRRGLRVTVLESGDTFLRRNLDVEGGVFALEQCGAHSAVELRFGCRVEAIESASVRVSRNGETAEIPAELTLISTGSRAEHAWLANSGLETGGGVIVDEHLRASHRDIFAAGDVAETGGRVYGLYPAARAMGKTAGINASGGDARFVPEDFPVRLNALGLKIFSAGKLDGDREECSRSDEAFRKLFFDTAGTLRGAELIGDLGEAPALQHQIGQP